MATEIEHDIPITETRGRHAGEDHLRLLQMKVGDSFVSGKRREALYQLARSIGIKVTILPDDENGTMWRVWKKSKQIIKPAPRKRKAKRAVNAA